MYAPSDVYGVLNCHEYFDICANSECTHLVNVLVQERVMHRAVGPIQNGVFNTHKADQLPEDGSPRWYSGRVKGRVLPLLIHIILVNKEYIQ